MRPSRTQRRGPGEAGNSANEAGAGLVIVDWSFKPVALDHGAAAILDDVGKYCGGSDGGASLPTELFDQLRGCSQSELEAARMHLSAGSHEYSCRTFLVKPLAGSLTQPMLALYLKRELSMADAAHEIGVDYHLTDREQEALTGILMGLSSKELAARMNISPNTVKTFLRFVMVRMGVTTRAAVVGKLLDRADGSLISETGRSDEDKLHPGKTKHLSVSPD